MTIAEILNKVQLVTDDEGNQAVLIDLETWHKLEIVLRNVSSDDSASLTEKAAVEKLPPTLDELLAGIEESNIHTEYEYAPRIPETMLLSESVLNRDWDRPEEDEAWADL